MATLERQKANQWLPASGGGRRNWRQRVKRELFYGDRLKKKNLGCEMAAQLYKFSKTHQTTCLNAQMLWYVNHTSIIMLKEKKASHRMGENIYKWNIW